MAFGIANRAKKKGRLSEAVTGGAKPKSGSILTPPTKNTKVGRSVLNDDMPGQRVRIPNNSALHDAITQPLQWSKPKLNSVKGNSRSGSQYREATDPKTGDKLHLYAEEAGGIPKEIVRIKAKKPRKTFGQRISSRL